MMGLFFAKVAAKSRSLFLKEKQTIHKALNKHLTLNSNVSPSIPSAIHH